MVTPQVTQVRQGYSSSRSLCYDLDTASACNKTFEVPRSNDYLKLITTENECMHMFLSFWQKHLVF